MITHALATLFGSPSPSKAASAAATSTAMCAASEVAMDKLSSIDHGPPSDKFYDARPSRTHLSLLDLCPKLRLHIPASMRLLTDDTYPGHDKSRAITVFSMGIPKLDARRERFAVRMGYYCSGLCGAEFEATLARTSNGWALIGEPRLIFVS